MMLVSGQALLLGLPHQISTSRMTFFHATTPKDKSDKVLANRPHTSTDPQSHNNRQMIRLIRLIFLPARFT